MSGENPYLEKVKMICSILNGEQSEETEEESNLDLSPEEMSKFAFAPITSVEVERSFSIHKFLLSERRSGITPKNLEMELIAHFEL